MVQSHPTPILTSRRRASVRLASWLSIIPGLGQAYNRQFKKAGLFLLAVVGLLYLRLRAPWPPVRVVAGRKPRGRALVVLSLLVKMLSLIGFTSPFRLMLTVGNDAMHDARATAQERNGTRSVGGRWWLFHR